MLRYIARRASVGGARHLRRQRRHFPAHASRAGRARRGTCSGCTPPLRHRRPSTPVGPEQLSAQSVAAATWASSSTATSARRTSTMFRRPRSSVSRMGQTAALVGLAALFAVVISVPLATLAAARKDRVADHARPRLVRCRARAAGLLVRHRAYRDLRRAPARLARSADGAAALAGT